MHCCYLQPWWCLLGNQNLGSPYVIALCSLTGISFLTPFNFSDCAYKCNHTAFAFAFTLKPVIATIWEQIVGFLSFACWILFHHEGVPYFCLFIHLTVDTCTSVSRLLWNEVLTSLSSRPTRGMAAFTQTLLCVNISRVWLSLHLYRDSVFCLVSNSYTVSVVWCLTMVFLALVCP